MPKYKLTYFNGRGVAEISRLLLSQGKADWEDVRIEKEKWPELKPQMPLGTLPCLEVDGKLINNSGAIQRYLAQEFGLAGESSVDLAKIDMICDIFKDLRHPYLDFMKEVDASRKEELKKKFLIETMPPFLKNLERMLATNGNKFLVGKSMSLADIVVYHGLGQMQIWQAGFLDNHQLLKKHVENIGASPEIKAWADNRPKTEW